MLKLKGRFALALYRMHRLKGRFILWCILVLAVWGFFGYKLYLLSCFSCISFVLVTRWFKKGKDKLEETDRENLNYIRRKFGLEDQ